MNAPERPLDVNHKRCSWPVARRSSGCPTTAAQARARPPFNARVEIVTTKPFLREPFTPNGGLVVQSGARSLRHRDAIISLAARYKLPAVYSARDYASAGGLLSYGPDQIGVPIGNLIRLAREAESRNASVL